jgi:hypothetical protein
MDLTNKMEALLILPLKSASFKANSEIQQKLSIGHINLGLKYKLYDQKWKISTGLQFQARTSKYDGTTGLSTDFNANTIIPSC